MREGETTARSKTEPCNIGQPINALDRPREQNSGALIISATLGAPVAAETEGELIEAFFGAWFVFDRRFSTSESPCQISLDTAQAPDDSAGWLRADISPNCAAPLSAQTTWRIVSGKIILSNPEGQTLAELGGEPERMTGVYAGTPDAIIL